MTRNHWIVLAAILLLAAALRLYGIGTWALNNDEIAEVRWSSGTFRELIEELKRDAVHPPLDYFVQHALGVAHAVEWSRRLPPVIFGVLTIAFITFLGTWWHSPVTGLAAGLLLAISPNHIRYSQEVRPYAMAIFFLAGAMVALELYAQTRERKWGGWWFALVFLAGATLYLAGLIAAIASVARILAGRSDSLRVLWRRFPIVALAWTILYAPWLGVVVSAARARPPMPAETLDWPWWQHRLGAFGVGGETYAPLSAGTWIFWLLVVIGIVLSLRNPLLRVASAWLIAGGAATVIILQVRPHYANSPRYLVPAMLAASLLAGRAVAALWSRRSLRVAAVALLSVIVAFSTVTLEAYYGGERPDWRAIAVYVHERARPGDTVILTNNWVVRNFGFYWLRLPRRADVHVERFIPQDRAFAGPVWIVTGQCHPREPLLATGIMRRFPKTEIAEVRYVRDGESISLSEELCPE